MRSLNCIDTQVCRCKGLEVFRNEVQLYTDMQVCRLARVHVYGYTGAHVCNFVDKLICSLQVCKCAGIWLHRQIGVQSFRHSECIRVQVWECVGIQMNRCSGVHRCTGV